MKKIRALSFYIEDEIEDAEKYVKAAIEYKAKDKRLADLFFNLSNEEMKHMGLLHTEVVRIIEEYRATHGDPPEGMMAMYDILHEKHVEDAKAVKILQGLYAES